MITRGACLIASLGEVGSLGSEGVGCFLLVLFRFHLKQGTLVVNRHHLLEIRE